MSRKSVLFNSLGVLAAIFLLLASAFMGYLLGRNAISSNVAKIRAAREQQNVIQFALTPLFLDYESAMKDYIGTPNTKNREKLFKIGTQLDEVLDQASEAFGLTVKRQVDLFRVWQYDAQQPLPKSPFNSNKDDRTVRFLTYQLAIRKAIDAASQDYNLSLVDKLLYGDFGMRQASSPTQAALDTVYKQEAEALIPAAVAELKNRQGSVIPCMPPAGDLTDPKNLATMVAILQYGSRYCAPVWVQSKTSAFCNQAKGIPATQEKRKELDKTLAACQIAQSRLQQEQEAATKYETLSYEDYFRQYMEPLVPQFIAQLKERAHSKNVDMRIEACNPNYLPVAAFRNPEVDAQIAAFERAHISLCGNEQYKDDMD